MRVDPEQNFIDHLNYRRNWMSPSDALKRYLPKAYGPLFERFKERNLYQCLKCRQWYDDNTDMSTRDIDICMDCEETNREQILDHADDEAKRHIEQGEQ